jgi:5-methylthioadenosine/S-adenosylhomocysteine deaminase
LFSHPSDCLTDWLVNHIWPGEAVFVSPEFVRDSCELGLAEMIRGGTTACNDMYWFPEVLTELVDKVGVRALIGLIAIDFPTSYAKSVDEYLAKGLALYESHPNHPRIQFSVAPHAPYTCSDETLTRMKKMAEEKIRRAESEGAKQSKGAQMHIHVHETAEEVNDSAAGKPSMACHRSTQKCRPLENFDTAHLGLLSPSLIAVHMTQLTPHEISRVAATGTHVVHCATSNLKLASGLCPVAKLDSAGVNVALGTDSTASNNGLDMFAELKLAAILAKQVAGDASAVPAWKALQMATLNGARAMGMDHVTGSLEVGKSSDFITLRLDDLELVPMFSVISHIVYAATREHVENVWVAGQRLMRQRKLVTMDEADVKRRALKWQSTMATEKFRQATEKVAAVQAASASAMDVDSNGTTAASKKRGAPEADAPSASKPKI